jgi:hypothetical protein
LPSERGQSAAKSKADVSKEKGCTILNEKKKNVYNVEKG